MHLDKDQKAYSAIAACFLLIAFALANLLAQQTQPSPAPSASASPIATISPTPARTPSPTPLPGAQNFHQWGSITIFNGLPSDSVRAIAQTPDGVMWFGTDNGLARFDGRRIQNFSLGSADANRVLVMKTSATGELWIGTRAGAIVHSEGRFQPVEETQDVGITVILLGPETSLGTDAGFVLRVRQGEDGKFAAERTFPEPIKSDEGGVLGITSLVESEGRILAGTAGRGVFVVSENTVSEFPTVPRPIFVNSLAESRDGKLWLGSDAAKGLTGIHLVDGGRQAQRITAPTANVLTLEVNDAGVWAGTERYGLFHIANAKLKKTYTFENTSGGLRSDTIYMLFTDREGVIWIGTNRGVSRLDPHAPLQQTVSEIPNSNFIRSLFQYGKDYPVLAGSNRGLFRLTQDGWQKEDVIRDRPIYDIDARGLDDKTLLLATPDGVFDSNGRRIVDGDARAINYFEGRTYVAIFGKGIFDITGPTPRLAVAEASVTSLGGYRGKMWIGTASKGLYSFDGYNTKQEIGPDRLKSGTIWNVAGDQESVMIAGQHGVFSVKNEVPAQLIAAEDVRDVFGTESDFWAATTTQGVLRARLDERFGWLVSRFAFEQGLPSEKAFALLYADKPPEADSQLLVGTNRGVVDLNLPWPVAPKIIPIRILSQRVHDLSEAKSTIPLEYPQNSLLVEVAGQSSRTFPEEFQYAFLLRNSKGDEIARQLSNDSQYAPTDLSPGDYVIEAIAFNRDLLGSEQLIVTFSVAKAPFPWTATALGVLLAIAIVALIWAVIERRRIVLRNRELAVARFDLAHEAERERSRIARDLHDQTLADLRDLIMKSDRELPPGIGFREDIESISTEVRRICEDLSPSVLENVGLIASLEFLLSHTVPEHKFNRGSSTDDDIDLPMNVQLQIYRIAQEVLTNIKQHAGASLVEMNISTNGADGFQMTILNDGSSFIPPQGRLTGGRGIAGIRTRAAFIHASPHWDTSPDGRARFQLSL